MANRIYLCLVHMSEAGLEQKYIKEALFKVGMCLPAGPYVSDEDVNYIVETIISALL